MDPERPLVPAVAGSPAGGAVTPGTGPTPARSLADVDRSLVHGIAWMGLIKWTGQLFSWLTTLIVARLLTPDDYGLMTMASLYVGLLTLASEFGVGSAIIALRKLSDHQIAQVNTVSVIFGVVVYGVACALAKPIALFFREPQLTLVIIVMSSTFLFNSLRSVPWGLLRREMRFKRLAVFEGAQVIVLSVITTVLAYLGFRYWTLVMGNVLSSVFTSVLALTLHRVPFARPRWADVRGVLVYSKEVILQRAGWYLYTNADFFVAGRFLGKHASGAYSFGWTLATTPLDKIGTLVLSVTPSVLSAVQDDRKALARYVLAVTEGMAVVVFPLLIGLALTASDFVPLVIGEKWRPMIPALELLAVYTCFRAILPLFSQVLLMTGDQKFGTRNMLAAAVVMPVAFVVGSHWGITGIAAAWVLVHPFIGWRLFRRVLDTLGVGVLAFLVRALWPAVSGCTGMAAAVLLVRGASRGALGPMPTLVAEILVGAVTYGAVLLLLHRQRIRELAGFVSVMRARTS